MNLWQHGDNTIFLELPIHIIIQMYWCYKVNIILFWNTHKNGIKFLNIGLINESYISVIHNTCQYFYWFWKTFLVESWAGSWVKCHLFLQFKTRLCNEMAKNITKSHYAICTKRLDYLIISFLILAFHYLLIIVQVVH